MKKGFTLIEILAVIGILGILMAIAVPSILTISEKMKIDMYCDKVEFVEKGAQLWGQDNYDQVFNSEGQSTVVKVSELVRTNYLKKDDNADGVLDPRDNSSLMDRDVRIFIKNTRIYADYVFNFDEEELCK